MHSTFWLNIFSLNLQTMKQGVRFIALLIASLWLLSPSFAQEDYPNKTITMVVPFPPGGVADVVGRPVAEAMGRYLKQTVIIENKGGAGGGIGPGGGAGAAPQEGGDAAGQGGFDLLRADEVDVGVDRAGGHDVPLAGDRLGARAHNDGHAGLGVGVARLADRHDAAIAQADVGLDDPPPVEDQGVGDHRVYRPVGPGGLGLAHAIADHLATAEFHFLAIEGEVLLNLNDEVGVCQADLVANRRAIHLRIGFA